MQIFNYDNDGFYTHHSTLDDSDRDPLNTDAYLIPAGATAKPVPELHAHQAARFDAASQSWVIVPDLVSTVYYLSDAAHTITERGVELPAGASLTKPQSMIDAELVVAKAAAIALIEQKASEFHALVIGTNDPRRAERFALNLELAQKLIAGTATAVEQQSLQMQLDANQQAGHPILTGKTLQQFAQWIVQYKDFSTLGSGLIEATLIKGRAAVNAAQSIEEIEQIKAQLAQQAQAAFTQLQTQLSG